MHPDILREMNAQRGQRDCGRGPTGPGSSGWRSGARRHGRDLPDDDLVVPAVPDYVDGSFRTDRAVDQVATEAGQAPVARHAA